MDDIDRGMIGDPALIRLVAARNQPTTTHEAVIVDVTERVLGLRLTPGVEVAPNRMIELGVNGNWTRGRVRWSREGVRSALIASVDIAPAHR